MILVLLAAAGPARAQQPQSRVFVDGAVMAENDPTEFFSSSDFYGGSPKGKGGRIAFGVHTSDRSSFRFELVVPAWHLATVSRVEPKYDCSANPQCPAGPVPAVITDHREARTVSSSVLYGLHLPAGGRTRLAVVAGFGIEHRVLNESGAVDLQLSQDGSLDRHLTFAHGSVRVWPSGVVGVDVQVAVTSHLSVVPQFRYDFFPYPSVSIVRVGVAGRWHF